MPEGLPLLLLIVLLCLVPNGNTRFFIKLGAVFHGWVMIKYLYRYTSIESSGQPKSLGSIHFCNCRTVSG